MANAAVVLDLYKCSWIECSGLSIGVCGRLVIRRPVCVVMSFCGTSTLLAIRDNRVVFPDPLGPITAILSVASIPKEADSNNRLIPCVRLSLLTDSNDMLISVSRFIGFGVKKGFAYGQKTFILHINYDKKID